MIPPEHPKDLFKRQGAEKGRTVEHGAFQPDRTPRKEVGSLEFVTTLVEIPFHCFSVQRTDGMLEENGNGNYYFLSFPVSVKGDICVIDALLIHSFVDCNIKAE